jgi:hypothetical protein
VQHTDFSARRDRESVVEDAGRHCRNVGVIAGRRLTCFIERAFG